MTNKKLWYKVKYQKDPYTSSWSLLELLKIHIWKVVWVLLYRYTPKHFFNLWRLTLLKLFGAKIYGRPFVYPSSKVFVPWNLEIGNKSCVGPNVEIYNLGPVIIQDNVTISQYCYICNGTHDLSLPNLPLMIGIVRLNNNVFIGAKALVLPGICIGENAVVGAGAVVTKDVDPWAIVGGNPAKFIKKRIIKE
ncbi:DapH/DapD/GlmU-related protein [Phocaeicola sp.]|uniref:DapH/DapD/GlmU-related protein n=1 Tax=Phocaeicola sp. TaxID=2773926 RepID=UPI003AB17620